LNPVFTYVSPSHKVVMGYEKSDLIGKDAFQLIHKDDKPGLIALLTEYLAANIESNSQQKQLDVFETIECRAKDIHGKWHYLQCTVNILGNELLFVSKDITKQKMAELALRDSELRYRTIFENTGTASVIIEEDTTISMVNSEFERLSGYSRAEIERKKSWTEFIPRDDLNRMKGYHSNRREKNANAPFEYEFRFNNRQGDQKYILNKVVMIPGTRKSIASLMDITEQRHLREKTAQIQRLEAFGTMVGTIVHDFNNLLFSIQGHLSNLLLDIAPPHPGYENIRAIENIISAGAKQIKQLLSFGKSKSFKTEGRNIKKVIEKSISDFGSRNERIDIKFERSEKIWMVNIDQSQIEQVLLNLYINAWQAMPIGGKIIIKTKNVMLNKKDVRSYQLSPGRYVKISVSDTGIGMDENTQKKIFEPFFSSRKNNGGTGLGLTSSYWIVKNHAGFIDVSSKEGKGSSFNIYLPALYPKVA